MQCFQRNGLCVATGYLTPVVPCCGNMLSVARRFTAMQFMPLLAISQRFFHPVFSRYHNAVLEFDAAASRLIPYQHFTFIPLLMVAKFGKPHLSAPK